MARSMITIGKHLYKKAAAVQNKVVISHKIGFALTGFRNKLTLVITTRLVALLTHKV